MTKTISLVNVFVPLLFPQTTPKIQDFKLEGNERISSRIKLWNTLWLLETTFQPSSPDTSLSFVNY